MILFESEECGRSAMQMCQVRCRKLPLEALNVLLYCRMENHTVLILVLIHFLWALKNYTHREAIKAGMFSS